MLHEVRLNLTTRQASVSLDFRPTTLTVINPTPYNLYVSRGQLVGLTAQSYLVSPGTVLSLPATSREWAFALDITGPEPSSMPEALAVFTQDEPPPTMTSIGASAVSFEHTGWGVQPNATAYSFTDTTWTAFDDTYYYLDVTLHAKRALILCTFVYVIGSSGTLRNFQFGVFDTADNTTYQFCQLYEQALSMQGWGAAIGVVDFTNNGSRRLYLRAAHGASAAPTVTLKTVSFSVVSV